MNAGRRIATGLATAAFWFAVVTAAASGERINTTEDGVAIKGFDTVAYFTEGRPIEGSPAFEHVWQDARWQFASAKHRDMFAADPEGYAPRYGGHCAGAMAAGRLWTIDPEAWAIVDGKLYLNFLQSGIASFVQNPEPMIERADAHWTTIGVTE